MIDMEEEQLLTMKAAGELVPDPKPKEPWRLVYAWAKRGVRGLKLESKCVGGRRYTSREAMERFFAAQTERRSGNGVPIKPEVKRPEGRAAKSLARKLARK